MRIAVVGIILAILTGLVCSICRYYKVPVLRQIASAYIELSRNTPLLVQLFFLYLNKSQSFTEKPASRSIVLECGLLACL